jgi:uncharacterized protein (DUF2164 family)
MPIQLDEQVRREMVDAIKAYFRSERQEDIGDLQAGFLLDFVLRDIGPAIYNRALTDAQGYLRNVIGDLDVTLGE